MFIKKKRYYEYNRPQIVENKNPKEGEKKYKIVQFAGRKITDDRNYKRPSQTKYDTLQSKTKIMEQLNGCKEVPISKLKNGTHYRYITWDYASKKQKYRGGGLLKFKRDKFLVFTNGDITWTVSKVFYKKGREGKEGDEIAFVPRFFTKKSKYDLKDAEIKKLTKINKKLKEKLSKKQ